MLFATGFLSGFIFATLIVTLWAISRANSKYGTATWVPAGKQGDAIISYRCSDCGWRCHRYKGYKYCPNCGDHMLNEEADI